MHQYPRPSARPPASPRADASRSANPRDAMSARTYSSDDLSTAGQVVRPPDGKESKDKANLVVQHFFTKAALIICSSRVSLPPAMTKYGEAKIDRWVRILSFPLRPHPCTVAVYSLNHCSNPCCRLSSLLRLVCAMTNLAAPSLPGTRASLRRCGLCLVLF